MPLLTSKVTGGYGQVDGHEHCRSFKGRRLADGFLTDLKDAVRDWRHFNPRTGRPDVEVSEEELITWYAHARAYTEVKWGNLAPVSHRSVAGALVTVTIALAMKEPGAPEPRVLRLAVNCDGDHGGQCVACDATGTENCPACQGRRPPLRTGSATTPAPAPPGATPAACPAWPAPSPATPRAPPGDRLRRRRPHTRYRWPRRRRLVAPVRRPWDDPAEHHQIAAAIGLRRAWYQDKPWPRGHYDVTELRRRSAIAAGAVPVVGHR